MTTLATRVHWHHPEWCALVLAVGGWASLALATAMHPAMLFGAVEAHTPIEALAHSGTMVQAMMAPLVLDQVNRTATFSLWPRRYRAAGLFLLAYLGVWTLVSAVMLLAGQYAASVLGWHATLVAAFAVACLAVCDRRRQRLVRQCSMTMPLALRGWPADLDCLRYGLRTAQRCVAVGWPLMLAVCIDHGTLVMTAGTALMIAERRDRLRRPRTVFACTACLGVLAAGLSFLGYLAHR